MANSWTVSLEVSRLKDEHVLWTTKAMRTISELLQLEGTDIGIDISVEKNRDGVERLYEILPGEDGS